MPRPTARAKLTYRLNHHSQALSDSYNSSDEENIPPEPSEPSTRKPATKPKPLKVQILEKDNRIAELESILSRLESELLELRRRPKDTSRSFLQKNEALVSRNQLLQAANKSLTSRKRKAETALSEEITKKHKRIKRLEGDRKAKEEAVKAKVSTLQDAIDQKSAETTQLRTELVSAHAQISSRDLTISSLRADLRDKQASINTTRNRLYASQKQVKRAHASLKSVRTQYKTLRTWNPMAGGQYNSAARKLARDLIHTGCAAGKVASAVQSCAEAFGIKIHRKFMSRRTVSRTIDEGGKYGELQLGREILNSEGLVESSDGTTHKGITVESRCVTLRVPSYSPGVDDSDKSTWKHRIRFVDVAPALDHTAQRQFDGTLEAVTRIADTYSRSPLAAREQRSMTSDDYYRKKMGAMKDHAADGKKEFNLSEEHKTDIVIRDLGRAAMDDSDIETSRILLTIMDITDETLQQAAKISASQLAALSSAERAKLSQHVLEHKMGEEKFDLLTPAQQSNLCTHLFGGCCCHKDLNVVEYGYKAIQAMYKTHRLPPPALLANKANSATIALGADDPTSAAVKQAMDASSAGAVKLLQLVGSLLRHKDGERGYQERAVIFMRERKLELYELDAPRKFPDVSNTRYGCYTYGAAEVICFHGIIQELVEEIVDGKTKSGQENHVESNVLRGLNCPTTMTENAALALYGVCVSWPYMSMVRGTKDDPVNLLSLTNLHRKLPVFCSHIASNPNILLDPKTPMDQLTIDGERFLDEFLVDTIRALAQELPNLLLAVSSMFAGAAEGWIRFTPEFHVGGTFDGLTPEQRDILFIPSTNDANEGLLGSFRVHIRYHPNSTAHSFSNQTRTERNNTEAFIKKICDAAVEKFVMREVRTDGKSGVRAKFRKAWAALQREKAEKGLGRRKKVAAKKKKAAFKLATTNLELDISVINNMTSVRLKDQLQVYRDVIKDPVLVKTLWKNMSRVEERRKLVLDAREREIARRTSPSQSENAPAAAAVTDEMIVDEYGYSPDEESQWVDVPN